MTSGKVVLLTGGSSGIGRIIAKTLAAEGHLVFASMRDVAGRNSCHARELATFEAPQAIRPIEIDVTRDRSVVDGVADVADSVGRIDVLVNCAGVMWTGPSEAFAVEQFQRLIDTNLFGPFRMIKAVLPLMRRAGTGLLLTVTSTAGRLILPNYGIYSASKFALEALAEAISYETADLGIQSVILEPGLFATNLLANQHPPADRHVAGSYGRTARLDQQLALQSAAAVKQDPEAYDPQLVGDAVAKILSMAPAERPLRQPVGRTRSVPAINQALEAAQGELLKMLGLGDLARC